MDSTNEKQMEARLRDIFTIAKKNREKKASNFLDPAEQEIARNVASGFPDMDFYLDGGYENAERRILVAYPKGMEDEPFKQPIGALRITSRDLSAHPGHRDYLGAILGLGINREKIGDILVGKDYTDIVVKEEIMEYIGTNLLKVGNAPVEVEEISLKELLKPERAYKEIKGTVASLRLDAVACIAFGISRSKMAPFIKGENVRINFKTVKDPSAPVKEGDVISANRLGRAKIMEVGGQSKKGRTYVIVHRYISR
ncbi:RNA-binding protein [Tepidanaerobacter syntrophicus]|uniref:YlmH family RNA-binding protein n=1 Tax=Tepidanaerobacter syntrophicus TaxID=224999 RepID=UPI001BD4DE63|nr:YlmH/Sll1252 family protein [Tepidanaerobacter syntrophicus]GLI19000.1 RNA-binding cell division protein [Tepidanaerobacter syntrophicus]